jgi:hypothetical protein
MKLRTTLHDKEGIVVMNEFSRSFATDLVPQGRLCEWCGKHAVCYIIALGGIHHNQAGYLCASCERVFLDNLRGSNKPAVPDAYILLPAGKSDVPLFNSAVP